MKNTFHQLQAKGRSTHQLVRNLKSRESATSTTNKHDATAGTNVLWNHLENNSTKTNRIPTPAEVFTKQIWHTFYTNFFQLLVHRTQLAFSPQFVATSKKFILQHEQCRICDGPMKPESFFVSLSRLHSPRVASCGVVSAIARLHGSLC